MITYPKYKVAAAHIAPVFNDNEKSLIKACDAIAEAARQGVRLIAFPEAYMPGYPIWSRITRPTESADYFAALAARALRVDGPEILKLCETARKHDIFVSMGFTEGTPVSVGCLWNSNVLIGADGKVLNHHRKLVPTFFERLVYARGDGAGLKVSDTEIGRIGMLVCGENTNPLARYALMAQGEQVHIASYPSITLANSADGAGAFNLQEGIRIRAAAHSFEAKAFTVVSSTYYDATARAILEPLGEEILKRFDAGSRSVSMVIDPTGAVVSEVLCMDEGLAVAEIDLARSIELKRVHDVVGYYNRFDVFKVTVNRTRHRPATFRDDPDVDGSEHERAADEVLPT